MKIVTLQDPSNSVLLDKTQDVDPEQAAATIATMQAFINELFTKGAFAGLAANQIGIAHSVFAFSANRTLANLEFAVNPTCKPVGEETITSWEACLSCKFPDGSAKAAHVTRYAKVQVVYTNKNGERVEKMLDGFAAKVFQHEFDHLQGTVNVNKPGVEVRSFANNQEFEDFMKQIRANDAKGYSK